MNRLQRLRPFEITQNKLKLTEIPALEEEIAEKEATYPEISTAAEKVCHFIFWWLQCFTLNPQIGEKLDTINRQVKDTLTLKQQTATITRLQQEVDRANQEVDELELSLSTTGSTKTADDVQNELSHLTGEMWVNFPQSDHSRVDRESIVARTIEIAKPSVANLKGKPVCLATKKMGFIRWSWRNATS